MKIVFNYIASFTFPVPKYGDKFGRAAIQTEAEIQTIEDYDAVQEGLRKSEGQPNLSITGILGPISAQPVEK